MIEYKFELVKELNGQLIPRIIIEPEGANNYVHLANLGNGHLATAKGVSNVLAELNEVNLGRMYEYSFGGDDWCLIDYRIDISVVSNGFDLFDSFQVNSHFIFELLREWKQFLLNCERAMES